MGLRFRLNLLPQLYAGEKIAYTKRFIWLLSHRSIPNYRIFFPVPPILEAGVYITDRRILFVSYIFRTVCQEFDLWFESDNRPPDTELIKEINLSKSRFLGPYLEIVSQNRKKMWYRSSVARIRLYCKDAEYLGRIASDLVIKNSVFTK